MQTMIARSLALVAALVGMSACTTGASRSDGMVPIYGYETVTNCASAGVSATREKQEINAGWQHGNFVGRFLVSEAVALRAEKDPAFALDLFKSLGYKPNTTESGCGNAAKPAGSPAATPSSNSGKADSPKPAASGSSGGDKAGSKPESEFDKAVPGS